MLHPNQVSISPLQLSVIDEQTEELELVDRTSDKGLLLLKKLYGSYTDVIKEQQDLPLSTPSAAEFTVPQVEYDNKGCLVREHPALRYELWKASPPDVILLGSSIFFCGFNREVFFEHYPDKKLLDFTTGNNTPFIAHYLMQKADSLHLPFKPGSIVVYGMNRVELLEGYKDEHTHEFVKDAINGVEQEATPDGQVAQYLRLPELRYDMTNGLKSIYDDMFRSGNVYRKAIDEQYLSGEEKFEQYIESIAPVFKGTKQIDDKRLQEIKSLADFLEERGSKLIVLKLPQSLYNDIAMNTKGYSYFDKAVEHLQASNIQYIDAADFEKYNIRQLDYIWSGNIFDPEHLNVQGAKRYTQALINIVLDSMINEQNITN